MTRRSRAALAIPALLSAGPFLSALLRARMQDPVPPAVEIPVEDVPATQPLLCGGDGVLFDTTTFRDGDGFGLVSLHFDPAHGPSVCAAPAWTGDQPSFVSLREGAESLHHPRGLRGADGRLQLFWMEVVRGGTALFRAKELANGTFGEPVALSTGTAPLESFEVIEEPGAGGVLVCFVARPAPVEDTTDLFVGRAGEDRLEEVRSLGVEGADRNPALARTALGDLWVTWTRSRDRDTQVLARRRAAQSSEWSEVLVLTERDGLLESRPVVAAGADGTVWFAWDRREDEEFLHSYLRSGGGADDEQGKFGRSTIRVLAWRDGRILEPVRDGRSLAEVDGPELLSAAGARPSIAIDGSGRVHVAYRVVSPELRSNRLVDYDLRLRTLDATGWSERQRIVAAQGPDLPACAMPAADGSVRWVFSRRGDTIELDAPTEALVESGTALTQRLRSLALGLHSVAAAAAPSPPTLRPLETPGLGPGPSPDTFQERRSRFRDPSAPEREVFLGDLHRHSNVSHCSGGYEPDPELRLQLGRDFERCDFFTLTDHSGQMDEFQWNRNRVLIDLYDQPRFATLHGYEWSSQRDGHLNVVLRGDERTIVSSRLAGAERPDGFYSRIAAGTALAIPHHPAEVGKDFSWPRLDAERSPLVEIYQARRGSYEALGALRGARKATVGTGFVAEGLAQGGRFGLVASSDHGPGAAYAGVWATRRDRESVFDALLARRCFATTAPDLLLQLGPDPADPGALQYSVLSASELAEVVLTRDGEVVLELGRPDRVPEHAEVELLLDLSIVPRAAEGRIPNEAWIGLTAAEGRFQSETGSRLARNADSTVRPGWTRSGRNHVEHHPPAHRPSRLPVDSTRVLWSGDLDSDLSIEWSEGSESTSWRSLLEKPFERRLAGDVDAVLRVLSPGDVRAAVAPGLGSDQAEGRFALGELSPGHHWYVLRAVRRDGEMAWSSPVFVDR